MKWNEKRIEEILKREGIVHLLGIREVWIEDIWAGTWGRSSVVLGREYSNQWSKIENEHGYRISSFAQGCRELERASILPLQWKK